MNCPEMELKELHNCRLCVRYWSCEQTSEERQEELRRLLQSETKKDSQ